LVEKSLQFFTEHFQREFLKKIREYARKLALPADATRIFISEVAYADAIAEADFDAEFVKMRRGNGNGNSEGKLAGILYFRLTRHKIIHFSPEIAEHNDYARFQERVVVQLIGSLLQVDFNDVWIQQRKNTKRPGGMRYNFQDIYGELQYLTCRRHYNQESLALFFDTLVYLQHALDEMRAMQSQLDDYARRLSVPS